MKGARLTAAVATVLSVSLFLVSFCALVPASGAQDVNKFFTSWTNGRSSWHKYDWPDTQTASGRCNIKSPLPISANGITIRGVAIDKSLWNNGFVCGMCIIVYGGGVNNTAKPEGGTTWQDDPIPPFGQNPFLAIIGDYCDGCYLNGVGPGLDVFDKDSLSGLWATSFQAVDCPVGSNNVQYDFEGSNPYYVKIQIRRSRLPVKSVKLIYQGTTYNMDPDTNGYFVRNNLPGISSSYQLEITAVNNEVITDTLDTIPGINTIIDGGVQFKAYKPWEGNTGDGSNSGGETSSSSRLRSSLLFL